MVPSFLIVVPTLDSFELLPRLCDSLRKQSCTHWRVLFVDGPSSRRHRDWLESYCAFDSRFSWISQVNYRTGIFGAMNQGFDFSTNQDWLLFWGSDDWASSPHALAVAMNAIMAADPWPDLLVCEGRYADAVTKSLGRRTCFQPPGLLSTAAYRRALWFGFTPPHQSTFFGPGSRSKVSSFTSGYRLSADLDSFLQLSHHMDLYIRCLDLALVYMSDGGISGQQTQRRINEVFKAYRRAYGYFWWCPFFARYIRRLSSLMFSLRR